ncbi:MAG: hypothetical protein M9890_06400 [Thermomicrobiales bacterium]|nr:hypothetical protein [Thermomicrobiales bacterium]
MASIGSRLAAETLLMSMLVMLLVGCSTPRIIRETPEANPPTPTALPTATAVDLAASPVATPTTVPVTVDRVVLSTRVDDSDAPLAETTVVSETARQIFLCVHVQGLPPGTPLRAYWLENEQIIAQSDDMTIETQDSPSWVALAYQPPFALKPDATYAVELLIDNQKFDRFLFRVGKGDPAKAIAEAAFATGFDNIGKPVGVRTRFPADSEELTFRARVSRMVEPDGWTVTTLWFRGDVLIDQLAPDPTEDPRMLTFTLRPDGSLPEGNYSVTLLLNGVEARTVPFEITEAGSVPVEEPTPTVTPALANAVRITDLVVTDRVNPRTNVPLGDDITIWDSREDGTADLWLAMEVENLTRDDVVEVRLHRRGSLYSNERLPRQTREEGWIAVPLSVDVPTRENGPVEYTITVLVNGNRTETQTLLVNPVVR